MLLSKEFTFEASHQIPNHPGKCARLHGHSWRLKVFVSGPVDNGTGMVMDYYDIKQAVQPLVDRLDHHHLGHALGLPNTVKGMPVLLPTSENLLFWIADQLPIEFVWSSIELNETCTSSATLTRTEWLSRSRRFYRKEVSRGKETVEEGFEETEQEGRVAVQKEVAPTSVTHK